MQVERAAGNIRLRVFVRGDAVDEAVGCVDDGAEAVAELGEDGVEVDGGEGIVLGGISGVFRGDLDFSRGR